MTSKQSFATEPPKSRLPAVAAMPPQAEPAADLCGTMSPLGEVAEWLRLPVHGLLSLADPLPNDRQIGAGTRMVGLDLQGPLEMFLRFAQFSLLRQGTSRVRVGVGQIGIEPDGPLEMKLGVAPPLQAQ